MKFCFNWKIIRFVALSVFVWPAMMHYFLRIPQIKLAFLWPAFLSIFYDVDITSQHRSEALVQSGNSSFSSPSYGRPPRTFLRPWRLAFSFIICHGLNKKGFCPLQLPLCPPTPDTQTSLTSTSYSLLSRDVPTWREIHARFLQLSRVIFIAKWLNFKAAPLGPNITRVKLCAHDEQITCQRAEEHKFQSVR